MNFKKWLMLYIVTILVFGIMIGLFNVAVDPYGVFGDKLMHWYAYDMTNNPRVAKIAYLDQNQNRYDSYIIGCSKTSSLSVDKFNQYYKGARFYNMIMYGGDMYDIEKTVDYIVTNKKPKRVIVNMGLEEANNYHQTKDPIKLNLHADVDGSSKLKFYLKYIFANPGYSIDKLVQSFNKSYLPGKYSCFVPETGSYNKVSRDVEPIGNMDEYLKKNPEFTDKVWTSEMNSIDQSVGAIKRIKEYCESKGVSFMLIASPVTSSEVSIYPKEKLIEYWKKIAAVTDFWDFSGYNSVSGDPRYFYDTLHFRNVVGDMALARIFKDNSIYVPKDFGHYTTKDNVLEYAQKIFDKNSVNESKNEYTKRVPILEYHQLDTDVSKCGEYTITPERFRNDLIELKNNGYTAITFNDLLEYVNHGNSLPEKPVIITFDDGYENVYKYAFPVLKELDMKATISVIGISVGQSTYKDTNYPINAHFSYSEAKEMYSSGLVDIVSHTYNMHDEKELQKKMKSDYRDGILQKKGESESDYIANFKQDYLKSKEEIERNIGNKVNVFVYPSGKFTVLSEALLKELGNKVTVSTDQGVNTVIKGLPQSLYDMKRVNVPFSLKSEDLISKINSFK